MVKKYFKLNNNLAELKRGIPNYNPCSRYGFVYKVMVQKMNNVTRRAASNGTINESSWGFGGYMGECGGGLIEKKVPKGGHTTFLMDIHHNYPRGFIHCHRLQNPKKRAWMVSAIRDLPKRWTSYCRLIV